MKRCVLLSVMFAVLESVAFAQQAPPGPSSKTGDPRKDARIHVGPFHMTPVLLVNNLGIDTNVFNAAGEQKSDFTLSVAPRLTIWTPIFNRALITTTLTNGITYYKTFSNQSSLDPGVTVDGELKLQRLTLFGTQSYAQSRQRPNYEIDVRVPQTSTGTSVGLSLRLGSRTSVALSAHRDHSNYGRDAVFLGASLRERLNRSKQGVQIQLDRQLTSLTSVHLVAENRQDKFEFSPDRDAAGYRVAAGVSLGRRALIAGEAEIGFRRMEFVSAKLPSFVGVVSKTALTYQRQGATEYRVEWNRDIEFSFDVIRPYYILSTTKFTHRRQLAGRFDAIATVGRNKVSYGRVVALESSPEAVTKLTSLDLGYRLTRDTRLGFIVIRNWRTSKQATNRDYSGVRAGISFSVGF